MVATDLSRDFNEVARTIQLHQQSQVVVSSFHIRGIAAAVGLDDAIVRDSLLALGCSLWPAQVGTENKIPASAEDGWVCLFELGFLIAPLLQESHPLWSEWLHPSATAIHPARKAQPRPSPTTALNAFIHQIRLNIRQTDAAISAAIADLKNNGFSTPDRQHVLQLLSNTAKERNDRRWPLVRGGVEIRIPPEHAQNNPISNDRDVDSVVLPDFGVPHTEERLGFWGYSDTMFALRTISRGDYSVVLTGNRYRHESASPKPIRGIIPFIEKETKWKIDPLREWRMTNHDAHLLSTVSQQNTLLTSPFDPEQIELLRQTFDQVDFDWSSRCRHGTGHSQNDAYMIRSGSIASERLPDIVVWPKDVESVQELVQMAKRHDWCLIPHGGGTNVTHATRCPSIDIEPRPIVSVDMRRLNQIEWINEEDGLASVGAGITGRDLAEEMQRRGYTVGHEPDSYDFSTLGGWVATKASGMKRAKYGNIEDVVKSVTVVTADGRLSSDRDEASTTVIGRTTAGIDLKSLFLGSEGCIGIVVSAVVRMWPIAETKQHESVVFPNFDSGLRFARALVSLGGLAPASVRLLDNEHFRLGQAMNDDGSIVRTVASSLVLSTLLRGFKERDAVCVTLVLEGTNGEVQEQNRQIRCLAAKHGGVRMGATVGRQGYQLTFLVAYLRDFALSHHLLGDSFETFVPWSRVSAVINSTKQRIHDEHRVRRLPGKPFVGARVTQLYHEGTCVYFYFCMCIDGVDDPSDVFRQIEEAARDEILQGGGSLSHHHGIGKVRATASVRLESRLMVEAVRTLKEQLDPSNLFGARNGLFSNASIDE